MKTREKLGLGALLLLGGLLRFGGMSHGLHEGQTYHPDVPKQVRAVQRFYGGTYFWHIGHKDYDGYPLFHAHLVEYIVRVVEPVRQATLQLLGVPYTKDATLEVLVLHWITLIMNATLSTLAILPVYLIGREQFGAAAAWIAAGFQTVSPIEVTASHLATGDATAAFCTALSLFFAFRILRRGRRRDYALAALTASCGFAAKYYAASAFFAILAAHAARVGHPAAWVRAASLRRLALMAAAAVAGLFLAIPSLFTHFRAAAVDIFNAMLVSSQRIPPVLGDRPPVWRIVLYSQQVNLPVLARLVSPALVPALLAVAATRLRRDPRAWVLLAGPVAYWVFGVGSRAQVHPVYHAVATPALLLLLAWCAVELWRTGGRWPRTARAVAAAAVAGVTVLLAAEALRELFFAWHMDTRRMGSAWIAENVPGSFRVDRSRYALSWEADAGETGGAGTLVVRSALGGGKRIAATAFPLKRFALEPAPLTQFRNVWQETYLDDSPLIRKGFSLPVGQRQPAQTGNQVIFDNGREFVRSEKLQVLPARGRTVRWLVAEAPLREAWVVARSGRAGAAVGVSFGGAARTLRTGEDGTALLHIPSPRHGFPTGDGFWYYRLRLEAREAQTRILLATRPGEAGLMLFGAGRYAEAAALLERGALEERDPGLAARALIAMRVAGAKALPAADTPLGELAARAGEVRDDDTLFAVYGLRAAYLDALPFLSLSPEELGSSGFQLQARRERVEGPRELAARPHLWKRHQKQGYRVWTPDLLLDPGHYRLAVALRRLPGRPAAGPLRVILMDAPETVTLAERSLSAPNPASSSCSVAEFDLAVPTGFPAFRLVLKADESPGVALCGLEARPDPLAEARALGAILEAAVTGDHAAAVGEPLAADVLTALGARPDPLPIGPR